MIDFCDAASEWGSIVPLPAQEASRMVELADQRRIASDEGSDAREQSHRTGRFDPYPDPDRMVTR